MKREKSKIKERKKKKEKKRKKERASRGSITGSPVHIFYLHLILVSERILFLCPDTLVLINPPPVRTVRYVIVVTEIYYISVR